MRCTYCGSRKHTFNTCPKTATGQSNRRTMRCSYCGSKQHSIRACPKTWNGSANRAWHPEDIADDYYTD